MKALLCACVLLMAACATPVPRSRLGPPDGTRAATDGPTRAECAELPGLVARLIRLERERTRIHGALSNAGLDGTSAEAIGDGVAIPGLALEAARSADPLEQMFADRTLVYPGLSGQIDWIAANWFDPSLMRWTSARVRALASMTANEFRDLKADTVALRAMLPEITAAKRRQAELKTCGGRMMSSDSAVTSERVRPPLDAASGITCSPEARTTVNCEETVVIDAGRVAALLRPLNSSSLSRDELRGLGPDASAWMTFARNAAGISEGNEEVYVDGMPAVAAVPPAMIGRITVNGDPFSAEYSNVGQVRIDVDLRPADRSWHADLSTPSFGPGGGSLLGPTGAPMSRSTSMSVSGPVPRLPVSFSVQAARRLDTRTPLFVTPGSGALAPARDTQSRADVVDVVQTTSSGADLVMSVSFVTHGASVRATFSDSRLAVDHAGIGGIDGPTTGQRLDSRNQRWQTAWRFAAGGWVHRGGFSFAHDRLSTLADSLAPLVMVTEQLVTGGHELAASVRGSDAWAAKHVVESGSGSWIAGVEARSDIVSDERTPNPSGRLQLSAVDARTGTWIVSTGGSAAAVRTTSAAMFAERLAVNTPRLTVRGGLRVDWQNRAGAFVSPRVVAAARISGFQLTGGAGLFVRALSSDLFVLAAERAGTRGATFVVPNIPGDGIGDINPAIGERLRMLVDPEFAPRRDLVVRAAIQRRFGPLQTGVEHTWTRGDSLPGAARDRDATGLVDHITSDRALRRHQTYVRSTLRRGRDSITAYYRHAWSFDDSDGPFVPPARHGDVRGEWAPSVGVARHGVSLIGSASLPGHIQLFLTIEAQSGTSYNIFTGNDPEGLAVFTDRGGRSRNTGTLPPYRKVSLSASRTVHVPHAAWLEFDVGMRADNLTNHLNVMSVGRVVGTAAFAVPVDGAAGRSIRFWVSLAR